MLWDIVFEFFIKYIFGGVYLGQQYYASIGNASSSEYLYTCNTSISILGFNYPLGNYFSLIATIITMVAIVLICCALIKKIYNMCAHIIG